MSLKSKQREKVIKYEPEIFDLSGFLWCGRYISH
nr:MAG TPA: hypothetical protein [Caudoviricetes sp.]